MDDSRTTPGMPLGPADLPKVDKDNEQRLKDAKRAHKVKSRAGDGFSKWLNRMSADIEDLDKSERLTRIRSMIKAHQYLDGNFYGYVDSSLSWANADRGKDDVWYSDNQIYPYFRAALMEMSRTQTEILVNAPDGASDELQAAAKFAKGRVDANRNRLYNALELQTRNAYALLNGIVFQYTFMDYGSGRKEKIPKLEKRKREKKDDDARLCANCARVVPDSVDLDDEKAEHEPKCPSCGSTAMIDAPAEEEDTIVGYDEQPCGQNDFCVPNPIGVIVSMNARNVKETPFVKWKLPILYSVLRSRYTDIDFPATGIESMELRYQQGQQKAVPGQSTGNISPAGTAGAGEELTPCELQQHWLAPELYGEVEFDEPITLKDDTYPAGTKLGEIFPDGLYFASSGQLILELANEDKNRKWSSSPYGIRPGSMYGTGVSVALSDQETLNDLEVLKMANAWANGVAREFVNPSYIKELSVDPRIPTNLSAPLSEGNIIGRAYQQAPAMTLSPEIYALSDRREASIQNKIGAMSGTGSGGMADAQKWGDTATAITIKRDLAVGRFAPDLELMADELDKAQAIQFLLNEQEYFTPQQWKHSIGSYGEVGLEAFLDCDICNDLIVTVSPGSYMPKSDAQMLAKFIQYMQILPVLAQVQDPELKAYASELFGIPESIANYSTDRAYATRIIERFTALADLFVQSYGDLPDTSLEPVPGLPGPDGQPMPEPSPAMKVAERINDYAQMPVDVFLDNHQGMIDALKDWRSTDAGRDANNALVAAVALRVKMHHDALTKQGQLLTQQTMDVNQPAIDAQKEEEAEAAQAQQEAEEQKMQAEGLKTLAAEADKDDQRQHEKDMAMMTTPIADTDQNAPLMPPGSGAETGLGQPAQV